MKILGIENLSTSELNLELQRGGKFVVYQYCVSIIVMTFRRSSDICFIKPGESAVTRGLPWTLLTLVAGWWGIPWGLVFTPIQIARNLYGIAHPPDPAKPSARFEQMVRMNIAAEASRQPRAQAAAAGTKPRN